MKTKVINGMLQITTNIYQTKRGALFVDFGNTVIRLDKDQANIVAYDIPDLNHDDYISYYGK